MVQLGRRRRIDGTESCILRLCIALAYILALKSFASSDDSCLNLASFSRGKAARRFARSQWGSKEPEDLNTRLVPLPLLVDSETIVRVIANLRAGHNAGAGSLVKLGDVSKFRL